MNMKKLQNRRLIADALFLLTFGLLVLLTPPCSSLLADQGDEDNCRDLNEDCTYWQSIGECDKNPVYMHESCRKSCQSCGTNEANSATASSPRPKSDDLGIGQNIYYDDGTLPQDIEYLIQKARNYRRHMTKFLADPSSCQNRHTDCAYWQLMGECQKNPGFMEETCAPMCGNCEISSEVLCSNIDWFAEPPTWKPGDVDKLFQRLSSPPIRTQYDVQILSSPKTNRGPWIISLDNLLSEEEADQLIEIGKGIGFERSYTVGEELLEDGQQEKFYDNEDRTSTSAWCDTDECESDPTVNAITDRISGLIGIPMKNSEGLQLLHYEEGQFYDVHHDFIEHQVVRGRPRILTVFLYLNDVEEGGGTRFDQYDKIVTPRRGRAVLWPSVLNEDPLQMDERTTHEALPVIRGEKHAANVWFHLRDFRDPDALGCMG